LAARPSNRRRSSGSPYSTPPRGTDAYAIGAMRFAAVLAGDACAREVLEAESLANRLV
jgi:hypothetical protein